MNDKEFERNRQKMSLKELNGMNTLDEQAKELTLALEEFNNITTFDEAKSIIDKNNKESDVLDKMVGESKSLPLKAIEKLLPSVILMADNVLNDAKNKDMRSLLSHACDDMATYSRSLIPDNTKVPSDDTYDLSLTDVKRLDKNALIDKWRECFHGTVMQINADLKEKDNIMLCSHCNNLWNLSNIADIFF